MSNYPSVTQVLRPYINTDWFKDEDRIRGQKVHAACLCDLQGLWYPPLKPEYQGYFNSWKRWADQWIDQVIFVETRLYDHDWKVCGKPDLIAKLKTDRFWVLIDLKTSQAEHKSWRLQLAAYRHLAQKDKGISTKRAIAVRLKSNGSDCLINEYPYDYKPHLNIFLGALNLHYYFNGR